MQGKEDPRKRRTLDTDKERRNNEMYACCEVPEDEQRSDLDDDEERERNKHKALDR